jgi:hypothetical protein
MNTGACTKTRPRASQRAARSAVGRTAVVVWSTIQHSAGWPGQRLQHRVHRLVVGQRQVDALDAGKRRGRIVEGARAQRLSARALAGLRFQTLTSRPLARARRTKPEPIRPVPKKGDLHGGLPLNAARVNDIARSLGLEVSTRAPVEQTIDRIRQALARAADAAPAPAPAGQKRP